MAKYKIKWNKSLDFRMSVKMGSCKAMSRLSQRLVSASCQSLNLEIVCNKRENNGWQNLLMKK